MKAMLTPPYEGWIIIAYKNPPLQRKGRFPPAKSDGWRLKNELIKNAVAILSSTISLRVSFTQEVANRTENDIK